jgi:type I restriction enzyme, S subunit
MAGKWENTTLGQLLESNGGSILTGPFGTVLKASQYTPTGVPVISVSEVGFGRIQLKSHTPRVDRVVTQRLSKYLLKHGDIVFARKGAGTAVERSALVLEQQEGWFLGSDGIRVRLPKNCSAPFISYWLQSQRHRTWMKQHSVGTTMPALNESIIKRIPICLAPLAEQKEIAAVLGALDDKIELSRRMNATLEAMARALFQSWFVDFDPVRAKLDGHQPTGLDPATAALFPNEFEDSEAAHIPKGWTAGKLSDIGTNSRRGVRPGEIPPNTPYIALDHMPRRCIALSDWDESADVASSKSAFMKGEILFGKLRPYFHKVGVAPFDGICSTDILVLAPKSH